MTNIYLTEDERFYLQVLVKRHLYKIEHSAGEWGVSKPDRLQRASHKVIFESINKKLHKELESGEN